MPDRPPAVAPSSPSAVAPADPMSDPARVKQVEAARAVAYHLLKGIKQIGMYRHNEAKFGEFLQKAFLSLQAYHQGWGTLQLKVELTNFTLYKQELFSEANAIPYKFYKDGIRQLMLRPGFSVDELVTFTLIALSDPDRGAEDLNAQLWKAQLPNLEYIMVEGFFMDEFSEAQIQIEVDQVVDALQRRLRTHSDDFLRFARVTESDLDMKLEDVDQMRGVVITGLTATPALKARLQREIEEEENQRFFPKLVSAVFQVVESGVDDLDLLSDMFTQLLDAMLLQEDFAIINQVALKLKAMEQRSGLDSAIGTLQRTFVAKMSEEHRLNRVGDVLKNRRLTQPQDIVRYLSNITAEAIPLLLDVLEGISLAENRALLCDLLVPFARDFPDAFVHRLNTSDAPQVQRDMVYVLDRANHPDKLKFFGSVLKSKNLALRLEVMGIIARGRTGEARNLIAQMLNDENMQVRLQAARVLPEFDRDRGFTDLLALVKSKSFEGREPQEKEGLYAAMGATGMTGAIAYFTHLLQAKAGLFNKQKSIADKQLAIAGLGAACTIQVAKLLQEVAEDTTQPPEVSSAAAAQSARVRNQLLGVKGG